MPKPPKKVFVPQDDLVRRVVARLKTAADAKQPEGMYLTLTAAKHITAAFADEIKAALANGEDVAMFGLGRVVTAHTPARPGRNPRNGDPVEIPAKIRVAFRFARKLKADLNQKPQEAAA